MRTLLNKIKAAIVKKVASVWLQPTSFSAYAVAIWGTLDWPENAQGIALLTQLLYYFVAFALFLFNDKPWRQKFISGKAL